PVQRSNALLATAGSLKSSPFSSYFCKASSIGLQDRGFAREVLPTLDDNIDIGRLDIHRKTGASCCFGSNQCVAAPHKRVIDALPDVGMVEYGAPHQLDRFLRAVIIFVFVVRRGGYGPKRRLRTIAVPTSVRTSTNGVKATLVLPVTVPT